MGPRHEDELLHVGDDRTDRTLQSSRARRRYNQSMLTALLFLVLTLLVFVAATVVAVMVMIAVGARRGSRTTTVDAATVSLIRRRARRLGLGSETPPGARIPRPPPRSDA